MGCFDASSERTCGMRVTYRLPPLGNRRVSARRHTGFMQPAGISATFQAGATVTPYRRAGTGEPVLLLGFRIEGDPLGALLFGRLAERFRVIAPEIPEGVPF